MLFEHNNPFEHGCPDDYTGRSNKKLQSGFEDIPVEQQCLDLSHEPPAHLCIPPGKRYRHVCPSCGYTVVLQPLQITCQVEQQPITQHEVQSNVQNSRCS